MVVVMKQCKRFVVVGLSFIAVSTIGLSSAKAFEVPNPLAQVVEQFQQQLASVNSYVSSIFSDKLKSLSESLDGDLQTAIDDAMGALGIPDPTKSREATEKIAGVSNSPINQAERATNEVDRQITRAVADTTLGKAGQERTKQQFEKTQQSIEQVEANAEAAEGDVVTQNVMKRIAQQNVQQAGILGAIRTDGLRMLQSQDLANNNLTNISRAVDGQNQAQARETVGQGFENYRTAAKARLF